MSWRLDWADEFDGAAGTPPDPTHWYLADDKNYESGTLNWYRPQNVALDGNSHCVITAKPEVYQGYAYTSGHMETQTAPFHNLWQTPADNWAVECSVQLPTGKGIWPCCPFYLGADWNYAPPPGRLWPACGELDHNEWYQLARNQIRINLIKADGGWLAHTVTLPFNIDESQHRYRTECQGGQIRCYVDGVLYVTFQKADVPNWVGTYDQPFILICQIEVGGNGGVPDATTRWPAQMIIDYIRAYSWVSDPTPSPIGGTTMNASQAIAKSSGWIVYNTDLYAYSAPAWAEYLLDFGTGDKTLQVAAKNYGNIPPPTNYAYRLDVSIDGVPNGTLMVVPGQTGQLNLPSITGTHTVRLTWTNDAWQQGKYDANCELQTISLIAGGTIPPPSSVKDRAINKLKGLGFLDDEALATVNP